MKNSISKFLGLAAVTAMVFTTSCSSDDDNNDNGGDNEFVVDRNDLNGTIEEGDVVLDSGTYMLTGELIVEDGATLTIKEGVTIEATDLASDTDFSAVRYIAVAQGGKLFVEGTASEPVVMTASDQNPGGWGGLVICGKASINKGESASAEVSGLTYGGTNDSDNSGSIKYLRIEYSGYAYNSEKEFNGLSLFGVGNGTTIENVQVAEGSDDGFEWFGGTVNVSNLIVTNMGTEVGDDLFDWTEGWRGEATNLYGIRTNAGNRGIEADNNSNNHLADPTSNPTIKNLTLVGNGATGEDQAFKLRVGTKGMFDNVVISNWATGFNVEHDETLSYVGDELVATNVKFMDVATHSVGKTTDGDVADVSSIYSMNDAATGAGNGADTPSWATGWTVDLN